MTVKTKTTNQVLQLRVENGTTSSGDVAVKSINFSKIKLDADDQALLDAGNAVALLQSHALQGLRRVTTVDLVEE